MFLGGGGPPAPRAAKVDPRDADTYFNIGMYQLYASGLRMLPNGEPAWSPSDQDRDEVLGAFKRALELNSRFAHASNNLGSALFLLRRYDEAVPYLRQAVNITPYWSIYHANLGEVLLAAGKADEAIESLAQAGEPRRLGLLKGDEYNSIFAQIYLTWGRAELKRSNPAKARVALSRLADRLANDAPSQPKVGEARRLMAECDRLLKLEQDALRKQEEDRRKKMEEDGRRREEEIRKQREEAKRKEEDLRRQQMADAERRKQEEELRKQEEDRKRQEEELRKQREKDVTPPLVQILSPDATALARDFVLDENTGAGVVTISGVANDDKEWTAKGDKQTRITVDGKPAAMYGTRDLVLTETISSTGVKMLFSVSFTLDVPIREGANSIEIVAEDTAGNRTHKSVVITGRKKDRKQLAQAAVQEAETTQVQKWALLVGVNQYRSTEITPLRFSVPDVRAIYDVLTDATRAGFSKERVYLLTDDQADPDRQSTRVSIYKALRILRENAKPQDLLLVYYSGHGYLDKGTDTAYLLPMDTDTEDLSASAIPNNEFLKRLADIPAGKKVILLDACHSGGVGLGAKAEAKLPDAYYDKLAKAGGVVTMASCSANQQSYEDPKSGHGTFTKHLLDALNGGADTDKDGVVDFQEAANYVRLGVSEWAKTKGWEQTPLVHSGGVTSEIPVAVVPDNQRKYKIRTVIAFYPDDTRLRDRCIEILSKNKGEMKPEEMTGLDWLEKTLKREYPKEKLRERFEDFGLL